MCKLLTNLDLYLFNSQHVINKLFQYFNLKSLFDVIFDAVTFFLEFPKKKFIN